MCHVVIFDNTRYIDRQRWNTKLEKSITHDRDTLILFTSFLLLYIHRSSQVVIKLIDFSNLIGADLLWFAWWQRTLTTTWFNSSRIGYWTLKPPIIISMLWPLEQVIKFMIQVEQTMQCLSKRDCLAKYNNDMFFIYGEFDCYHLFINEAYQTFM